MGRMGLILPQFLQEPVARQLRDFVQGARFLEEVSCAGNDFQFIFTTRRFLRVAI